MATANVTELEMVPAVKVVPAEARAAREGRCTAGRVARRMKKMMMMGFVV